MRLTIFSYLMKLFLEIRMMNFWFLTRKRIPRIRKTHHELEHMLYEPPANKQVQKVTFGAATYQPSSFDMAQAGGVFNTRVDEHSHYSSSKQVEVHSHFGHIHSGKQIDFKVQTGSSASFTTNGSKTEQKVKIGDVEVVVGSNAANYTYMVANYKTSKWVTKRDLNKIESHIAVATVMNTVTDDKIEKISYTKRIAQMAQLCQGGWSLVKSQELILEKQLLGLTIEPVINITMPQNRQAQYNNNNYNNGQSRYGRSQYKSPGRRGNGRSKSRGRQNYNNNNGYNNNNNDNNARNY
jgi:hypothetical protein